MKKFFIPSTTTPFQGIITAPGDKSISHRALMLAAISKGVSTIENLSKGDDVKATGQALEALGILIKTLKPGKVKIYGSQGQFFSPSNAIDCRNSGTTMRLLPGLLAGQPFASQLIGDASLAQRPMERVITPLRQMGVAIHAEGKNHRPPLIVGGNKNLFPLHDYTLPIPSAQLKSSLILAALSAKGTTTITEPAPTRNHTEELFKVFQLSFTETKIGPSKKMTLTGPQTPQACNIKIPGDISSAAFWIVAATARPESHLKIKNVTLNPTRTNFLKVLERMNKDQPQKIHILEPVRDIHCELASKYGFSGADLFGDIVVQGTPLTGTTMEGSEIPGLIDELPVLAVAGALAQGNTVIRDAQELRVKETDRIAALVYNLRAMGVSVIEYPDGLEIEGGRPLKGASLKSFGDHRIAMAFSIAALFAESPSTIDDITCISTSYPDFEADLNKIINQKFNPHVSAE